MLPYIYTPKPKIYYIFGLIFGHDFKFSVDNIWIKINGDEKPQIQWCASRNTFSFCNRHLLTCLQNKVSNTAVMYSGTFTIYLYLKPRKWLSILWSIAVPFHMLQFQIHSAYYNKMVLIYFKNIFLGIFVRQKQCKQHQVVPFYCDFCWL